MSQVSIPPAIPCIQVAGRVFTDLTNLIVLYCSIGGVTNRYGSARNNNTSAGYAVPAAKTLTILAVKQIANQAAGSATLMYADNDSGVSSTTAPTNPVYLAGAGLAFLNDNAAVANQIETTLTFSVPTGKYITIDSATSNKSATFVLYGYLS